MRLSAAFTSPPDLILRRASATATFSLPWKYLLAVSDDIAILTFGSQSTSSDHSQCRFPSSPARAARMLTTRSRSVNSNRCGTSASRSFRPMSVSSLIIEKTRSITVRNSFSERNSAAMAQELDGDGLAFAAFARGEDLALAVADDLAFAGRLAV